MAEYNRLQNSFATGYLDPLLYGLFTSNAYNTGLKQCLNYIPSFMGYLYRRPGTRFVDFAVPSTATENRLHAMSSANGALLFLISEGRIDFFSTDLERTFHITNETVYDSITGKKCSIPWKKEDLPSLSVYEFEGDIYIVHKDYRPHKITVLGRGTFTLRAKEIAAATYHIPEDPEAKRVKLSNIYVANAFYCAPIEFKTGGIETFSERGHYPSCQTFKGGRWYLSGCNNSPASIYASKAPDSYGNYRFDDFGVGNYYLLHLKVIMRKFSEFVTSEETGDLRSVRYESETKTQEEVKVDGLGTKVPGSTSEDREYRYATADGWKIDASGNPSAETAAGSPANTKLLVVETTAETWSLRSNLQNDDAIELTETDMYGSRVNWLITQQRVIAGTNRSIWMDDGSAATPTTFDLVKTLGVTTSRLTPIIHSSMIIFVPADRRSVKAFNYDTDAEGYVLTDISATARSLFYGSLIKDITIVEGNETLIWVLLENGRLLSCTMGSSYGWAEHELGGNGRVISMSAYHTEDNIGQIFFTVQRGEKITVEKLIMEDIVNTDVYTLCDCAVYLGREGREQNLAHLGNNVPQPYTEGDTVQIVAGGWPRNPFTYAPETVDVGLGSKGGIYIGYAYTSRCHMLWQELPVNSGQTSLSFFRKAISMALQVYRSAGAECGWVSGTKKHLDPFQKLAKSNEAEPTYADYYTGIVKLSVPSHTNEQVNAVIECSYPLPMTIQAIETRYSLQEV